MTREELKTIRKSRGNTLAGELRTAIANGATPAEAKSFLEAGAALTFYEMDPAHPRSRFFVHQVLDACFHTGMIGRPVGPDTTVIAPETKHGNPETFRFLLRAGAEPGSNGWSGPLFRHILMMACLRPERHGDGEVSEKTALRDTARAMFSVLWDERKETAERLARNSYDWTRNPEALEWLLALGLKVDDELVTHARRYADCAPNPGQKPGDAAEVARILNEELKLVA